MKKFITTLLVLFLTTSVVYSIEIGSKFSFGIYYTPSITLDDSDDLPIYSSTSSIYDIEPLYFKTNNTEIGPYISILHISDSIVYNNIYLREFCALGLGLDWGQSFNNNFKLNTKLALGVGAVGESLNKEMYINLALNPSYKIINKDNINLNFDFIVNFIYRKYLLSPSIGIGTTIILNRNTTTTNNNNSQLNLRNNL